MHNKPHSEETKEKLRAANLGKKLSEETKLKIGAASRGKKTGKRPTNAFEVGHEVSSEVREKLRVAHAGKRPACAGWNVGKRYKNPKIAEYLKGRKRPEWVREKIRQGKSGSKNPMWKGGRIVDASGYVLVMAKDHPLNVGGYVLEHRIIMESKIGRYLKKEEVVHHINGVRGDNSVENLELFANNSEHLKKHHPHNFRSKAVNVEEFMKV